MGYCFNYPPKCSTTLALASQPVCLAYSDLDPNPISQGLSIPLLHLSLSPSHSPKGYTRIRDKDFENSTSITGKHKREKKRGHFSRLKLSQENLSIVLVLVESHSINSGKY